MSNFPKPMYAYVGRTYHAAVELGVDPGNLNRDRADTLIRTLTKTTGWLPLNQDVYKLWVLGGEPWNEFIKDLGRYTKQVRAHQRELDREAKAEAKAAERAAKLAEKNA